jgi:transposase
MTRRAYPSDVSDDEWAFVVSYLTLMREDALQREHSLREVFNGLRYIVHTGMQWRFMAHDPPPWRTVYQQRQRWFKAGVFEDMVHDLRMLMGEISDRTPQPRAAIPDSRTAQSTPESGGRAGYDGHKRLEVVKLPTAKRGFVLLPCRWVVERSLAWMARFRRLARDYGRLAETLAGLHFVAFAMLFGPLVHHFHDPKWITRSKRQVGTGRAD